jgi:hypothetical protein
MAMGFFVTLVTIVAGIAIYIMAAVGLYGMASNCGMPNPWLAWIPIGSNFLSGSMVGEMELFGYKLTNIALLNLLAPIAGMFLSELPLVGSLILAVCNIFVIIVHYHLFKKYRDDTTTCVLYAIFSFVGFFLLRKE